MPASGPRLRRRLAWYGLGSSRWPGSSSRSTRRPRPISSWASAIGSARSWAGSCSVLLGVARRGRPSPATATTGSASPTSARIPGALLNSTATAFIDEVAFRGALFGLLFTAGVDSDSANLIQTMVYALTTRLGAPGRDRYLLVLTLGIGLFGGWLTALTGGIAAAFLGHAVTRFAVFLCTGHVGQIHAARPRGRRDREAPSNPRRLASDRVAESSSQEPVTSATRPNSRRGSAPPFRRLRPQLRPRPGGVDRRRAATGRAVRPHPVLRLAVSVLRLRGLCRRFGARPEGPGRSLPGGSADRAGASCRCAGRGVRGGPAAAGDRSTSAAGRPRSCRPRTSLGS